MAERLVVLGAVPMVRRLEYLDVYLEGIRAGLKKGELETALGERKRAFEVEKDLALGRGKPHRKDIGQAGKLIEYCARLSRELRFVDRVGTSVRLLLDGRRYLDADLDVRRNMFAEAYSEAYPHLAIIIASLLRLEGYEALLPLNDKPFFRPEIEKIGISCNQMTFDTARDIATWLGLVNWHVEGLGADRRQRVYLCCRFVDGSNGSYSLRIKKRLGWFYVAPSEVERVVFRNALWDAYMTVAEGVPGSPVFYSSVRERVCAALKIRDDQFAGEVMRMVDWDDIFQVIWSEGVLPFQRDSASLLKSLPPKNEWDRYVVYLKIVRR